MKRAIKMADWSKLPRPDQDRELRELVTAARQPPNGERVEVRTEIAAFERKFGCNSEQMRERVRSGKMPETWEVSQWLMALHRRDRFAQRTTRPG